MTQIVPLQKINSYDLLKFLMAVCIVAHHTGLIRYSDTTHLLFDPINGASVPCFLVLSSFFFFRKCRNTTFSWVNLEKFVKRLSVLYGCWFIISLPIVLEPRLHQFRKSFFEGLATIVYSLLGGSTFGGSWFLTALIEAIVIFFVLKKMRVPDFVQLILAFFIYFSITKVCSLCTKEWLSLVFENDLSMTVCKAYYWIVIGYMLSSPSRVALMERLRNKHSNYFFVICILILYLAVMLYMYYGFYSFWIQLIAVPIMLVLFYCIKLKDSPLYKRLRDKSILIFFIHFIIIRFYSHFFKGSLQSGPICFIVVFLITYIIAFGILFLSNKKTFKILKHLI